MLRPLDWLLEVSTLVYCFFSAKVARLIGALQSDTRGSLFACQFRALQLTGGYPCLAVVSPVQDHTTSANDTKKCRDSYTTCSGLERQAMPGNGFLSVGHHVLPVAQAVTKVFVLRSVVIKWWCWSRCRMTLLLTSFAMVATVWFRWQIFVAWVVLISQSNKFLLFLVVLIVSFVVGITWLYCNLNLGSCPF